ncbi:MAG: hypothetical protein LC790_02130, partial [Actinobacteria bacterium]|nr:hypothetical protein [Actinomycetota bacterium]
MAVGEYSHAPNTAYMRRRSGGPLGANSKAQHIGVLRTFFVDLQEWEWIERRFDPRRVLRVPRSVSALIGPDPRVIADDVWAKLLWAGLNLTAKDLPGHATTGGEPWYPLELVRAIALLWLFGGLRNDEIVRLRLGAIRWQHDHPAADAPNDLDGERQPICLLDVPTNKTGTSFTKPVDRVVGGAIEAWETARAPQPTFLDAKTAETVDLLFAHRGARIGFYDLGHGYCSYSFFEQCPHRMACARCDFYLPKDSTRGQLLEANTSLQRMLVEIPLTDDERAAVTDDHNAVKRLLDRLADTPTPAGPTPR